MLRCCGNHTLESGCQVQRPTGRTHDFDSLILAGSVSCRGALAVASDSFGRVLLIDIVTMTVVRVWKSYRDAQFGWVMCTSQSEAAQEQRNSTDQPMSNQAHPGKRRRSDQEAQGSAQGQEAQQQLSKSLHLVLYAPRRRALELWQMRSGARVATVQVPSACKLLQRSLPFGLKSMQSDSDICTQGAVGQCMIVDIMTGQTLDVLAALHFRTNAISHESAW